MNRAFRLSNGTGWSLAALQSLRLKVGSMKDLATYRNRLYAMRDRLREQMNHHVEDARDVVSKPGEQVHLHTHNADMDVEGLDEAVALNHNAQQRLHSVEDMLAQLDEAGEAYLTDERQRMRLDALLDNEDFIRQIRHTH